ncbi:hypothetical protein QQF64_008450 [Cirrhinus molitorella]|uniref:Uncharacterized protein n=1 Tax=Cirrhinus molitorella TaxID=172907 RepID=A0ABR3M665_9TELE
MPTQTALQCFDSFFLVISASDDELAFGSVLSPSRGHTDPYSALLHNSVTGQRMISSDDLHCQCIFFQTMKVKGRRSFRLTSPFVFHRGK